VLLALGSFPLVSLLCLGAATMAAVVLHAKVQKAAEGHRALTPYRVVADGSPVTTVNGAMQEIANLS
jgi:hypothetical protein